jgi:Pyruvate:ferredoxin oxidoreductase and related 2-oxoacid:ferredoxin oxidoreductases, beta subunit
MEDLKTYAENTWCPGCGNFGILNAIRNAIPILEEKGIKRENIVITAGIGCHAKIFDYLNLSGFYGLHGRNCSNSEGIKIANPDLKVINFSGDGNGLGEGLAHTIFAAKRNQDMTFILHNNSVYALTTGQFSPLTEKGPMLFPPSKKIIKWNSYEHDEFGITTENAEKISFMHDKRNKKVKALIEHLKRQETVKIIRGENPTNIFTYGSTYMSVLEALKYGKINPSIIAPIYLNPLPIWGLEEFKNQNNIVIEQSITGQFTSLLKGKAGLNIKHTITQYDGRPFDPIELSIKIKEVL